MDRNINRRRFLKTAAAIGGAALGTAVGAATAGIVRGADGPAPGSPDLEARFGRGAGEWIPSCCNACGGQCGIFVHVIDGRAVKIEPNDWNPNNYANISTDFYDGYTVERGVEDGASICPKGNAGIATLYDPDRVQRPLKRMNPQKGRDVDPGWQEISWDQAVEEIAAKLRAIRDAGAPEKLLWWSEDHSFTHPQQDFCALFGTPNYSNHSNLCDVSRKASYRMVMGDERPLADFIQSKYIMLFGWNPTSAIKWVHLPRVITQARERGARMVVVDPYLSDTAAKADEWVPIRPGTDGALALALAHVIVRDKLYDEAFVQDWTSGFDEFAGLVANRTPQWAESITSVPAATIERLGQQLGMARPALVDVWSGPGQHSNGVQGGRAIALLNALVGTFDRPGGMMIPDKRGSKWSQATPEKAIEAKRFDGLEDFPWGHSSGVYGRGFQRLLDGNGPYQPTIGMCVFQNLVMSGPGSAKVEEALKKLETFIVVDTHVSETALLADYLIPGTHYLERYDLNSHWVTWSALGLRQPVVGGTSQAPAKFTFRGGIFGQMAEYEFVAALGRELGLKDKSGKEFFRTGASSGQPVDNLTAWYEEQLSNELKTGAPGVTLDEMRKLPGAVWVDSKKGTAYEKYNSPLKSSLVIDPDGKVYDKPADDPKRKQVGVIEGSTLVDKPAAEGGQPIGRIIGEQVYYTDGDRILDGPKLPGKKPKQIGYALGGSDPRRGFFTNSGKVEFADAKYAEKKDATGQAVDAVPDYRPRAWQPDADFPLYLVNWKEASHTHTRSFNNPLLLAIKGDNPLVIHPATAERYAIADGDEVVVESPYASTRAKAKVTTRIHPEVVGAQHGFGHWASGRLAKGRGTAYGDLNEIRFDPLSGQATHKEICVRVRKA